MDLRGSKGNSPKAGKYTYGWSCACGDVKFKMIGEPMDAYNCCCQSCNACADAIMAKGGGGTSWNATGSPGVAIQLWESINVIPEDPENLESKVEYMKVTETGTMIRWYTTCCNTPIGNLGGPGNCGLNFNCVTNPDGSKFQVPPLKHIMAKYAKDPAAVPEPKVDDVRDLGFILMVVPQIIKNKPWFPFTKKAHPALLPYPSDVEEWVPKTWADP